jgi:putative nucleotidyltransferase with HDIG domain
MGFVKDRRGQIQSTDHRDVETRKLRLDEDPIFHWVHQTKLPFVGKAFSSNLLERIGERPPASDRECAIIPLGHVDGLDILVYVTSAEESIDPGPFQLLELLSWHINPPPTDAQRAAAPPPTPASALPPTPTSSAAEPSPESDRELGRMIGAIQELPPMPNVVTRILQLLSDPNSKMADLTEVLSHDQALVARLIKVGNSAFYGRGQKTSTLSQAVVRLGTRTIRSLVLAATTRSLFPMDQTNVGIWGQALWQHSVECGLASRRVAELVRYADPEEAFVGGVLHDVGKVVILLSTPEEYRGIRKKQTSGRASSVGAETAVLGFDHTRVGELLLERWQMPQNLKACVRYHHDPHEAGDFETLASIVACGDYLSHTHGAQAGESGFEDSIDITAITERLRLSLDHMQMLQEKIVEDFAYSNMLD